MLEALRLGVVKHNRMLPFFREYIATLLYTGLRPLEVKELLVKHVRFNDQTILAWRHDDRSSDLKTPGSHRDVPLYPQLAAILEPYGKRVARRLVMTASSSPTGRRTRSVRSRSGTSGRRGRTSSTSARFGNDACMTSGTRSPVTRFS